MSSLIDIILSFKELIIIGIAAGGAFFIIFSVFAGNITWKSRSMRIFGVFMGLNVREMLWLSVGAVRILFVLCACAFTIRLGTAHMAFFVALLMLSVITFFEFPRVLIEVVNSVAVYAALISLGILIGYFRDINNNPMIFVIYILLSIFVVLYSVYFYMRGISDLVLSKIGHEDFRAAKK